MIATKVKLDENDKQIDENKKKLELDHIDYVLDNFDDEDKEELRKITCSPHARSETRYITPITIKLKNKPDFVNEN